ncbi:hypothetical protein ZEAMMB73_Zm00001d013407 [Zea mays]|uniref:Uncharacterized protein n=1 Tax=Zea mays TaxID=4577 RepID=A0A1D6GJ07_MAIZE|nr:hypothetical protein ZEAMMB73_Zm00001d013407 [Zea mays]
MAAAAYGTESLPLQRRTNCTHSSKS